MTASTRVVNIDTSRLSQLIVGSGVPWPSLTSALEHGDLHLLVCLPRLLELARLPEAKRQSVADFLDAVPTLIGQPDDVVENDELACACASTAGLSRRPPKPFARDTGDWGTQLNTPGYTAGDLLRIADVAREADAALRRLAEEHLTPARMLRAQAAVVRDPLVRVRSALHQHLAIQRQRHPTYALGLAADDIIKVAGGLAAFPMFQVKAKLLTVRLTRHMVGEPNDVFDEEIAKFHPYCELSVLDSKTRNRFWEADLPRRRQVVASLDQADQLVASCTDASTPNPFYLPPHS